MPFLNRQKLLDSLVRVPQQQAVMRFVDQLEQEFGANVPGMPAGTSTLAGTVVDWALAPTFILSVTGNITMTFINNSPGLSIKIWANRPSGSFAVTWPTAQWPGLIVPSQATNTLWEFTMFAHVVFGQATTY